MPAAPLYTIIACVHIVYRHYQSESLIDIAHHGNAANKCLAKQLLFNVFTRACSQETSRIVHAAHWNSLQNFQPKRTSLII